jgi:hypothetical protein
LQSGGVSEKGVIVPPPEFPTGTPKASTPPPPKVMVLVTGSIFVSPSRQAGYVPAGQENETEEVELASSYTSPDLGSYTAQ